MQEAPGLRDDLSAQGLSVHQMVLTRAPPLAGDNREVATGQVREITNLRVQAALRRHR